MKFEWYKEKPKYYLPAAWVYRWFDSLKTKRSYIFFKVFRVMTGSKKMDRHQNFIKEAGIDIEYNEN